MCGCLSVTAQDSTHVAYDKWLNEVVVSSKWSLYKTKPDVLIYDVAADSTLLGKSSFEALRNVPMLIVERNGKVRTVNGYKVEYLLNGLHDRLLSGNIHDAMESLPVKYLKRIEVRFEHSIKGDDVLQVNFVTKGIIYGYRGTLSSELQDDAWRNSAYLFYKKRKWGFSFSYFNKWQWDHESTSTGDEYRYSQSDLYHKTYASRDEGFKVDLNNLEMRLSYEFDSLSVLSLWGRALFKTNPHRNTVAEVTAWNDAGNQTYAYNKVSGTKMNDAEYEMEMTYERLYGKRGERGKFYAGYQLYSRPTNERKETAYHDVSVTDSSYITDFYDMSRRTKDREIWHTLNILYNRKMGQHEVGLEEFVRYRDERDLMNQRQRYSFVALPYESTDLSDFVHRQWANYLQAFYTCKFDKLQMRVVGTWTYIHDYVNSKEIANKYTRNTQYVTPSASLSYVPARGVNLRLSYSMGKQIPSIYAIDPYVHTDTPGELSYGNINLKPQTNHNVALSVNARAGKVNLYGGITNSFSRNLMLRHSFLRDGLLHSTIDNMGHRYELKLQTFASSKFTRTTWMRVDAKLYYTDYTAMSAYKDNRGFTLQMSMEMSQNLPHNFDVTATAGYNSPWISVQGKGGEDFYYSLRIDREFQRQRLSLWAEANSFIPIHYIKQNETRSKDYFSLYRRRSFHAAFSIGIRWRFGRLKAESRETSKSIRHDDIKYNYDE